ncbi:calsyntenin-1-like [Limulus polyphemus]|uniref:Calsyntenin-1-like n=1 Tax=Limulus polyphemus TaxID=6850 RepID=A0ABM1B2S2_LIMPO|nr:calsyntenin-1-like [Limulus polyphemus]
MLYNSGIILLLLGSVFATQKPVPRLDNVKPGVGYHAIVKENDKNVEVTPKIRVINEEPARFLITSKHHGEIPFRVQIKDPKKGEAILVAEKNLNCEKRKSYKFEIAAVGRNGEVSENATVHLTVEDVNEYAPVFLHDSYITDVDEERLYDSIIQVKAEDRDCTPKYSDICKYEILTPDQPFTIDSEGRIRNTEPLSWEQSHNYILRVVAFDCGMKRSKPVNVNIKVNKVCHLGWKGVYERIEYLPKSGQQKLFPSAKLDLCDVPCKPEKLSARVAMATGHIGKGCDRDTYSMESQRKLCGASSESVDLLPTPELGATWTRNLPTDEGHESDQIYEFDGATSAVVPETVLNHNLTDNFTVAFWMKHEAFPEPNHTSHHVKEHIICNADDHVHNRHHYSIFVRNCKLILLLRREFYQERPSVFRPAEWRWKIPEVCDNQWHHYGVSVKFPEVILFVDGDMFTASANNPEIIDDWPLHPMKDVRSVFVVGACWQGHENKTAFHFRGYLAGLSLLREQTENPEVLSCLYQCKESLEEPPVDLLEPGMELMTNSKKTQVTIEGNSQENLEKLVSNVMYLNTREFPTPGRRNLYIDTVVMCSSGKPQKVPEVRSYVMVLKPDLPVITINGTSNLAREYEAFKLGIELFNTVSLSVNQHHEEEFSDVIVRADYKLDKCSVQVFPPLNPDHEYFHLPENLMVHLDVHHKENNEGLVIFGADKIHNYELILRQIIYYNRKPAYYLNRAFKLVCSELNNRFVSNEYIQTLTVIHPRAEPSHEVENHLDPIAFAHSHINKHKIDIQQPQVQSGYINAKLLDSAETVAKTSASHAMTIIIVVCVGFLAFMIVLGVIRIRAAHHRSHSSRDDEQEMAWDDSSLTITVNPMEQVEEQKETRTSHKNDDSDSDDGSSYHEGESSEEETEKVKERELEWDDSNMSF